MSLYLLAMAATATGFVIGACHAYATERRTRDAANLADWCRRLAHVEDDMPTVALRVGGCTCRDCRDALVAVVARTTPADRDWLASNGIEGEAS